MFTKEMVAALEADGEKLRQLTGVEHGPEWVETPEEARFREVRDMVLPIVRDRIECATIDRLNAGCERANCACAEIACEIAAKIAWPNE